MRVDPWHSKCLKYNECKLFSLLPLSLRLPKIIIERQYYHHQFRYHYYHHNNNHCQLFSFTLLVIIIIVSIVLSINHYCHFWAQVLSLAMSVSLKSVLFFSGYWMDRNLTFLKSSLSLQIIIPDKIPLVILTSYLNHPF